MCVEAQRLHRFFDAKNVAVVGASEHGLYPSGIIQNLIKFEFPGDIYPVNPKHEQIFGLPCYASITDIPHPIDLAILVINRNLVVDVVKQCVASHVKAILIITAGFSESDEQGKASETEIARIVSDSDTVVLGPNCAGYADLKNRLIATRLPCACKQGGVSFISQSGALMMALYGVFCDEGIGINKLISVGNQMDVDLGEGIQYLAADESTKVIGSFIEGLQDGKQFKESLESALLHGKPVVLIKSGRTKSGQKAAATHTAAVAGSDQVFQAVCEQFGAALVDDVQPMMNLMQLHQAFHKKLALFDQYMIVTQSGGMGSLTADFMERAGLTLAEIGPQLKTSLMKVPHFSAIRNWANPADVRGTSLRGDATLPTLLPFLQDETVDLVVLLLARTTIQEADVETARVMISARELTKKPLIVVWVGQRESIDQVADGSAIGLLKDAGIPVFNQSSDAVNALSAAVKYWKFREQFMASVERELLQ